MRKRPHSRADPRVATAPLGRGARDADKFFWRRTTLQCLRPLRFALADAAVALKSKTGAGGQVKVQVVRVPTADVVSAVTRAAGKLRQGAPVARPKCERHRGVG